MVPVGGLPIVWHIMKYYASQGHTDFILCLGYKGEVIKEFFRNYLWNTSDVTLSLGKIPQIEYHTQHDETDWRVTLVDTGATTQTGGRLKRVLKHIEDETFLFTYGDGLIDSDVNATIAYHKTAGKLATVTAVYPQGRFGDIAVDNGLVTSFNEKPDRQFAPISGGFFVLNKNIGDYIHHDGCVFEKDVLPKLSNEGQLSAHIHTGFWQCMDTYREQMLLEEMWKSGKAPWKIW
jgi:glucose-1-phosphate cytidylyltransferase